MRQVRLSCCVFLICSVEDAGDSTTEEPPIAKKVKTAGSKKKCAYEGCGHYGCELVKCPRLSTAGGSLLADVNNARYAEPLLTSTHTMSGASSGYGRSDAGRVPFDLPLWTFAYAQVTSIPQLTCPSRRAARALSDSGARDPFGLADTGAAPTSAASTWCAFQSSVSPPICLSEGNAMHSKRPYF